MDAGPYLTLLKRALTNDLYIECEAALVYLLSTIVNGGKVDLATVTDIRRHPQLLALLDQAKETGRTMQISKIDAAGKLIPLHDLRKAIDVSHTMIGRRRLDNLESCLARVIADGVPGDLIETGVWRGGATIFMRGFLEAYGIRDRVVWVADSFEGLPVSTLPQDVGFDFKAPDLAISLETVQRLFDRYGLLDAQVRFLKGWFHDTLPNAPITRVAVMRLDGDLYESTRDALHALYDKLSLGGFVIIDDFHACPPCGQAVQDFRRDRAITDPLQSIDQDSVYWRKGG
jgi:hypothetical protein